MVHELKKLKGRDYDSHCRNCGYSESGDTYNIVVQAKKHAIKENHSVEYYTQSGKVIKFVNSPNQ